MIFLNYGKTTVSLKDKQQLRGKTAYMTEASYTKGLCRSVRKMNINRKMNKEHGKTVRCFF